jgi:hypothetical protein
MYEKYSSVIQFDDLPDPSNIFELIKKIGEGTYGSVHMALDKRSGQYFLAGFF